MGLKRSSWHNTGLYMSSKGHVALRLTEAHGTRWHLEIHNPAALTAWPRGGGKPIKTPSYSSQLLCQVRSCWGSPFQTLPRNSVLIWACSGVSITYADTQRLGNAPPLSFTPGHSGAQQQEEWGPKTRKHSDHKPCTLRQKQQERTQKTPTS